MDPEAWREILAYGIRTKLLKQVSPFVGSIILTDRCNLACRHCAVANLQGTLYPLAAIRAEMTMLYQAGVRVLLFYGGEPFLWTSQGKTVRDLVIEAKTMGFLLVSIVTNGTHPLEVPEADLILVSLDGDAAHHDAIRGQTYDLILKHIRAAPARNLALYMAVNRTNLTAVGAVLKLSAQLPQVTGCAFNLHTPYPGTEALALTREEKLRVCREITEAKRAGAPVLNLVRAFPALIEHRFMAPCQACIIVENGQTWPCGRCSEIPGLCGQCGFAFAAEVSLLARWNLPVLAEFFRTWRKTLKGGI